MPQINVKINVITQTFEDGNKSCLSEALFFPEVTCLDDDLDDVQNLVTENVLSLLAHVPNSDLSHRLLGVPPEVFRVQLDVEPAERSRSWKESVTLELPAIKWQQSSDVAIVYLPSLGIEILANKAEDLPRFIEDQIRLALFRTKTTRSLKSLTLQARCRALKLHSVNIEHFVIPPKQQAQDELKPEANEGKVLTKVADLISGLSMNQAIERDDVVLQLADALTGRVARSVLLVGSPGVGKSAVFKEVVRRSTELGLGLWKFRGTSGSRLVSGMTGFGMWQERCENLRKEMIKENVILHVGSLMELMEVGRSECQTQGIASFLRPAIARGEILLVAECTPEQLSLIERQDVALLRAFLQLRIDEPPQSSRIRILTKIARVGWTSTTELFSAETIAEIERLHRRFATYSAFPARPVRFLQNLRRDVAVRTQQPEYSGPVISEGDVTRAFSRETGLPLWLLDDQIPLDLAKAEAWISARVIGQPDAVSLIVTLLATLKAKLNRDHKPLASFLFIGPTGVGKTEMAKTLADYLFGSAGNSDSRLIRIDMSEYADPLAVQRLIGGTTEAEGVLTARVREQPFAVVLLDEFEKAHHSLFDLLLQILGEGRLTDAAGRVADFRNSVVIMTSNLGAATFAKGSVGFGLGDSDLRQSHDHFEKSVREFVRPELFNRIDRIVPFSPLDRTTARKVVERQLDLIRQRDGLKYRRVNFRVSDDVIDYLLEHGFEPHYGARSLKRVMEKELLAPLAQKFNQYATDTVLSAECDVEDRGQAVFPAESAHLKHVVRAQADSSGRLLSSIGADAGQLEVVTELQSLRSRVQRLKASSVMLNLENRLFQLERTERRWNKSPRQSTAMLLSRHELNQRRDWLTRFEQFLTEIVGYEDAALMALYAEYAEKMISSHEMRNFIGKGKEEFAEQLLDLLDLQTEKSDEIRLLLIADDSAALKQLAFAYWSIASEMNAVINVWVFRSPGSKRESLPEDLWNPETLKWDQLPQIPGSRQSETWQLVFRQPATDGTAKPLLLRQRVTDPKRQFNGDIEGDVEGVLGCFLEILGSRTYHRFVREDGLHRFRLTEKIQECSVYTNLVAVDNYLPPQGIDRRGIVTHATKCRDYDYAKMKITDAALDEPIALSDGKLSRSLSTLLLRRHMTAAEAMIE
jgi:ATP-dependent Clp protease ATP-binding subunit ClpC